MKRTLVLSIVVGVFLALPALNLVWGKAHVPIKKVQVCHMPDADVITVGGSALQAHLKHGDFQVPACSTEIVRFTGADCSDLTDEDEDGKADGAGVPVEGSPGCPEGAELF